MIVTVTCNPAYDLTYTVDELSPGRVHRVRAVHQRAGGKGVNVAAVLAQLGAPALATGLATAEFATAVEGLGIATDFEPALTEVRRTVVVADRTGTTSFWDPGVPITAPRDAARRLRARIEPLLTDATCLVVSGSLAPGLPPDLPAGLAAMALLRGIPAIVDTAGESLARAACVPGLVLMPNEDELTELTGSNEPVSAARALVSAGVRAVIATRGSAGMVLVTEAGGWRGLPVRHIEGNPTGAGDAAAAAVAVALSAGHPPEELLSEAVAVSAAAVAMPVAGLVDLTLYEDLRTGTTIEHIEELAQ